MSKLYLVILCLLFQAGFLFAQNDSSLLKLKKKVSLVFAGDIMGHMPQVHAAWDSSTDSYNYEPCFRFVKPLLDSTDIAIANLEVSLGGKPYTGYPTFSSPDDLAVDVKKAGFDILATSNNHCYDKGKYGFERTLRTLDTLQIPHFGTYYNKTQHDSAHPYILVKNGIKIALINYTYSTNGISPLSPNVVNYIDRQQILEDLKKADSLKVDFTIAVMHWGNEYEIKPRKEQRDLAKFMAANGCDAVIGSHPHVVQTFENIYPNPKDSSKVVPVFYSMGNLMSNQRDKPRDGGAMFNLIIEKNDSTITLNYNYLPYWVYKGSLKGKYQYYIVPLSLYKKDSSQFRFPTEDAVRIMEFEKEIKIQFPNLEESKFFDK